MAWEVCWLKKLPELRKPVLVEGLPGIGNVGKIAVDFLIDSLNAVKVVEFRSFSLPHSVFVGENGLVELPHLDLYHAKTKIGDVLLLAGDVQPISEESCYEFCDTVLKLCRNIGIQEIVTTGGIGLRVAPKKPKVYVTGTTKALVKHYKEYKVQSDIFGVVGPVIGVSGVLCGLAVRYGIPSVALLVEVLGHPMYVAVRGARELLRVLNGRLQLKLDFKVIEKEILALETEIADKTQEAVAGSFRKGEDINYIG